MSPQGNLETLPIDSVLPQIEAAFRRQPRLLLGAPTGSGKSTRVPPFLLDCGLVPPGKEVVVLQPRRMAARMLARRVASERGGRLGGEVGYQVRFERQVSAETRLRYVTEGILLRQMTVDPALSSVGAILFDEFHERHLEGDVLLALGRELQRTKRPDLLLGVLSATLQRGDLEGYLSPCELVASEGRTFPVEVRYAGEGSLGGRPVPVWERIAKEMPQVLRKAPQGGDVLVFLPGAFEIRRTVDALKGLPACRECEVLPLYGDMPPEQQDAAVLQGERRRIIVATNVAETSLTIPGVTAVVDSGLARRAEYDPRRGIDSLLVQKISRASAEQRTGRAGRVAPGMCVRLWSLRDQETRLVFEPPEIRRVDLAETVLQLKKLGVRDVAAFPWLEAPEPVRLAHAVELLEDLGAIESANGDITALGERMAAFPLHPRLASLLFAAEGEGCLSLACEAAAVLQGRGILLNLRESKREEEREHLLDEKDTLQSDVLLAVRALQVMRERRFDRDFGQQWGLHGGAAREAHQTALRFLALCKAQGMDVTERSPCVWTGLRRALLRAFSDRLAKRQDRGTLRCALVHGRGGEVRRESNVRQAPLLVCAEMEEREARGTVTTLVGMNTAVEAAWLEEFYAAEIRHETVTELDRKQKRVVARTRTTFRGLELEAGDGGTPDADEAARLLAGAVAEGHIRLKKWDERVEAWIARLNTVATGAPELGFPVFGEEDRPLVVEQLCHGAVTFKEVEARAVLPEVQAFLSAEQLAWLEQLAPEKLEIADGRNARLRYEQDGTGVWRAVLAATVQQLYDAPAKLTIAEGCIPVRVEILAPNRRPVQVTDDLGGFWERSYAQVKKDLAGRYPKHEWR